MTTVRYRVTLGLMAAFFSCFGIAASLRVSCKDTTYFTDLPVIKHLKTDYFLTWKQGSYPYAFFPEFNVENQHLVFRLEGTSSTGSRSGKNQQIKIEGSESITALKRGGAYWIEPSGTEIKLKIIEQ